MLDLGCGSAVWTAAVVLNLPETHVVGIDITPPTGDFGLDNLTFVTANIEDPWEFATNQVDRCDLITARVLASAIRDWPSMIWRCYDHLKSGGWIEILDVTIGTYLIILTGAMSRVLSCTGINAIEGAPRQLI